MHFGLGQVGLFVLALPAILLFCTITTVDACTCYPAHPQTHFCDADYVVIIRVLRKSKRLVAEKVAYKIEIKKSYKMNSEAHKMLKHGRLLTPDSDSMCGVKLELGQLYLIAGRAPDLSLCDYYKEYTKMTVVERRGFSGVYRKGCKCQIKPCFNNSCSATNESCRWSPFTKCETDYSACMPTSWHTKEGVIAKCHWRRTPSYKECIRNP